MAITPGAPQGDFTTYDGQFKTVYHPDIERSIPEFAFLQERVPFGQAQKLGDVYSIPVTVSDEGGITYLGEEDDMSTDLNAAISGQSRPLTLKGSEMQMRAWFTTKALESSRGNDKAFKLVTSQKVFSLNASMRKRVELNLWYGQHSNGVGVVESVTDLGSSKAAVVITAATWAPGIWQGVKNHLVDSFTSGTLNKAGLRIDSVDLSARKLVLNYASASTEIAVGDTLHFNGLRTASTTWKEAVGLKKIASTTSGSLFGQTVSDYDVLQPNLHTVGGLPSFELLQDAAVLAANRGCMEKLIAMVPTKAWVELNKNEASLKRYAEAGKKAVNGFSGFEFEGPNGTIEVMRSPFIMEGEFFLFPENYMYRVGAKDITFDGGAGRFFWTHPSRPGYELRCMSDQALVCTKPSYLVYGSGLSYS